MTLLLEPPVTRHVQALSQAEIERLRATRLIVADRVRQIMIRRTEMPPPVHGAAPG